MTEARKRAVIERIQAAYRETDAFLRSLSAQQLERPVFSDEGTGWRVRDFIAHFALWQTLAARSAEKIATGEMPKPDEGLRQFLGIPESLDALNQGTYEDWRERRPDEALAELRRANDRLVDAITALPADRLLTGEGPDDFRGWMPGVEHLRLHREHINNALKEAT